MKTIEERARECVRDIWDAPWDAWDASAFLKFRDESLPAVTGALTEQKAIDINKACEWLENNLYMDKGLCIGTYVDTKADIIADFRKAMGKE